MGNYQEALNTAIAEGHEAVMALAHLYGHLLGIQKTRELMLPALDGKETITVNLEELSRLADSLREATLSEERFCDDLVKNHGQTLSLYEVATIRGPSAVRALGLMTGYRHGVWFAKSSILFALKTKGDVLRCLDELVHNAEAPLTKFCEELLGSVK